jgi:hypothetical protein
MDIFMAHHKNFSIPFEVPSACKLRDGGTISSDKCIQRLGAKDLVKMLELFNIPLTFN